jgi:putative ATP-dependent endonuclease of OLD family
MADYGRRSVVFAVEEPESFLHPAAQENLRDDLEGLASKENVSMLITTHSPFIPSRKPDAQLIALAKSDEGATHLAGCAPGNAERTGLVLSLFRSAAQPELLERAAKADARGLIVLEGGTDAAYLRIAAERLGRSNVLEGLELIYTDGAMKAARRGLLLKDELPGTPMMVIFDDDQDGCKAHDRLKSDFNFKPKHDILMYSSILPNRLSGQPVEAEDLFATSLIDTFIAEHGPSVYTGLVKRDKHWGAGWQSETHYDLTQEAKALLPAWLGKKCKASDVARWGQLLDILEKRFP